MVILKARIATASDHRQVATLCRRAVGSGDYVLKNLREVIDEGGLFLAFHKGTLVGMTDFDRCADGSGWLSKARTDPDWRGRGVAGFLQRYITAYAKRKGIDTLRLWTYAKNAPAINACQRGGFRPVCEATHVSHNLRKVRKVVATSSLTSVAKNFVESILGSRYLLKMNGYLPYGWHFVKITRQLVKEVVSRRELYCVGDIVFILTGPESWDHKLYGNFTLLSGPPTSSLRAVKMVSRAIGLDAIGAYIPRDSYLLRVAHRLGFKIDSWGKHSIVFEKNM